MSIRDFAEKIKARKAETLAEQGRQRIFIVLILILTASFAFGLGRISVAKPHDAIQVGHFDALPGAGESSIPTGNQASAGSQAAAVTAALPAKAASEPALPAGSAPKRTAESVFASKSGTKYYPQGCKAGNRVSEANKIWFETAAAAEAIGLTKGTTCK